MTFSRRLLVSGLALILVPVVIPSVASANNWHGATGNSGCSANMQDNTTMTYYRNSLSSTFYNAVAYALNNVVSPTDVALAAEAAAPDGNTDVVYNDADYVNTFCGYTWHSAGNLIGYTWCASLTGSRCQRFDIYTDSSWELTTTTTLRRRHACHETGHSLGLDHPSAGNGAPNTTCMAGGSVITYDQTHEVVGHINPNY